MHNQIPKIEATYCTHDASEWHHHCLQGSMYHQHSSGRMKPRPLCESRLLALHMALLATRVKGRYVVHSAVPCFKVLHPSCLCVVGRSKITRKWESSPKKCQIHSQAINFAVPCCFLGAKWHFDCPNGGHFSPLKRSLQTSKCGSLGRDWHL